MNRAVGDFHDGNGISFECGVGGFVAYDMGGSGKSLTHVVISGDWCVHITVAHPIGSRHGRMDITTFASDSNRLLGDIQSLFDECHVEGPFAIAARVTGLMSDVAIGARFRQDGLIGMTPYRAPERLAGADPGATLEGRLRSASRY